MSAETRCDFCKRQIPTTYDGTISEGWRLSVTEPGGSAGYPLADFCADECWRKFREAIQTMIEAWPTIDNIPTTED